MMNGRRMEAANSSSAGCAVLNGLWRSLVAHLTGGQGVAGSNPVSPTIQQETRLASSLVLSNGHVTYAAAAASLARSRLATMTWR
jgi:hypothetical protein